MTYPHNLKLVKFHNPKLSDSSLSRREVISLMAEDLVAADKMLKDAYKQSKKLSMQYEVMSEKIFQSGADKGFMGTYTPPVEYKIQPPQKLKQPAPSTPIKKKLKPEPTPSANTD